MTHPQLNNHTPHQPPCGQSGELSDLAIIERVLNGDLSAYELIMRRYNQRLFRIARGMLGADYEAEDVVQEAYVSAWKHLADFKGNAKFATWLTRILVNAASARRRKKSRIQLADDIIPMYSKTPDENPLSQASRAEAQVLLGQAVDSLPEKMRTVFVMRLVEGLSVEETADGLGISCANVKTRLHRARALVREALDKRIGAEAEQLYRFDGKRCDRLVSVVLSALGHNPEQQPRRPGH